MFCNNKKSAVHGTADQDIENIREKSVASGTSQ